MFGEMSTSLVPTERCGRISPDTLVFVGISEVVTERSAEVEAVAR
jgi:hypothetical protein